MKKTKFRFNILDFLILAMVVLCIVGAVLRGSVKSTDTKLQTQTAVITFRIDNIQKESLQYFKAGSPVYSQTLGCAFGTLVGEAQASPAVFYVEDDGKITKVESVSGRVDVVGQFEAEGAMSESGFSIGGTQYIAPGMSTYASFSEINATILITDVSLKNE